MKDQKYFLKKAEENMPVLYYSKITPQISTIDVFKGDSFILDLGDHYVGHLSFKLDNVDDFIDAPTKLTIKFGEDMNEINDDFSKYNGTLSRMWLQEEGVIIDYPMTVNMQRRYSCRYIKVTVDETNKPVRLYDFVFTASTSANPEKLNKADISDPILKKIDEIAAKTLRDCMQTFFEDGPKRDRRLWIGDLRLEALANYCTYNNSEIVKRSLYLFAAGECNALGFLPSYVYETPYYFSGRANITDYALLYVVSLCDYFENTKDMETVADLLDICKAQLDNYEKILDSNLIITQQDGWFYFIDWCMGLRGLTALQGVYLYTLERFAKLLEAIGDEQAKKYEDLRQRVQKASREHLFNEEKGVFVNALDGYQLSVHSQVWMILGGVIEGETAKKALNSALGNDKAQQPFTPYMWHYVVEAMFKIGMKDEAIACIKKFWGGMIERGADTFYEVYVPTDPDFSPYNDRMINSLCHAWSCTPSYFIRKYGLK
jgi:hypothetical protein